MPIPEMLKTGGCAELQGGNRVSSFMFEKPVMYEGEHVELAVGFKSLKV